MCTSFVSLAFVRSIFHSYTQIVSYAPCVCINILHRHVTYQLLPANPSQNCNVAAHFSKTLQHTNYVYTHTHTHKTAYFLFLHAYGPKDGPGEVNGGFFKSLSCECDRHYRQFIMSHVLTC